MIEIAVGVFFALVARDVFRVALKWAPWELFRRRRYSSWRRSKAIASWFGVSGR